MTSTRPHGKSEREEEEPSLDLQLLAEAVTGNARGVLENTLSAVARTLDWLSLSLSLSLFPISQPHRPGEVTRAMVHMGSTSDILGTTEAP